MRRREFITLVGGAAAVAGVSIAAAQARARQIVILGAPEQPRFSEMAAGLKDGLRDHGYGEATLEIIEQQVMRGDQSGTHAAVRAAMRQGTAVLLAIGSEFARMARQTSSELPIVFITPGDPVTAGLVASLRRPGGNTTAMMFEFPELSAKRLELLQMLAPAARTVLVLYDPRDASPMQGLAAAREAAPKLGLALIERPTRNADDVARGLEALDEADALLAIPGGLPTAHYEEMIRAANARRRPAFFQARSASAAGALASYGASDTNVAREAARLIDKILKGEKAGDLPVERPTKFELVINLKTAKALGLELPASVLARADDVIE
jgi:putative tryptophan/tyrosine transport system substrate-binding protein